MPNKSIYLGPRLKAIRRELGLTQANMAADLDISPSYIALMERNQRPVTADMLVKLASIYRIDIADLASPDGEASGERLRSVLSDPLFSDIDLPSLDIDDVASSFPGIAEAIVRLHTAFAQERIVLAERTADGPMVGAGETTDAVAEARAFLAARRNYFPSLEASAAAIAENGSSLADLEQRLADSHGLAVEYVGADLLAGAVRWYDYHRRRVMLANWLDHSGRRFQLAMQLAILEQGPANEALIEEGRFLHDDTRQLVERALQAYWAAALLMPYTSFHRAATRVRYDIALLASRFSVSFEQAAHRLTTLQRPGASGVPFAFLRVDPAGNVSKRLDGAGFPFARHAGGCPLLNIHAIFARERETDAQLIELPDGERFLSIARTVHAGARAYGSVRATRAIALICSADKLDQVVYGDALAGTDPVPVGVSCRICHRPHCVARAAPPIGRDMLPNRYREDGVPFAFSVASER